MIKFDSQKEHDEYCLVVANKLQSESSTTINAKDVINRGFATEHTKRAYTPRLFNKNSSWADTDLDYLKSNYGHVSMYVLEKNLKRSRKSIHAMVNKLRRTGAEIKRLR